MDLPHYIAHEQMVAFFGVELVMVAFLIIRPIGSITLLALSNLCLYCVLYRYDGASAIRPVDFLFILIVAVTGMILRFHSQLYLSTKTAAPQETNKMLEYAGRHDALTGLRNRLALEDDLKKLKYDQMKIHMIDINYFKEINDTYGHLTGDEILKEVSKKLRQLYPQSLIYRFGGDEFLVVSENESDQGPSEVYSFECICGDQTIPIVLSVGTISGTPQNRDDAYELINRADKELYVMKKRTHSAEYGGHDRRASQQ